MPKYRNGLMGFDLLIHSVYNPKLEYEIRIQPTFIELCHLNQELLPNFIKCFFVDEPQTFTALQMTDAIDELKKASKTINIINYSFKQEDGSQSRGFQCPVDGVPVRLMGGLNTCL